MVPKTFFPLTWLRLRNRAEGIPNSIIRPKDAPEVIRLILIALMVDEAKPAVKTFPLGISRNMETTGTTIKRTSTVRNASWMAVAG